MSFTSASLDTRIQAGMGAFSAGAFGESFNFIAAISVAIASHWTSGLTDAGPNDGSHAHGVATYSQASLKSAMESAVDGLGGFVRNNLFSSMNTLLEAVSQGMATEILALNTTSTGTSEGSPHTHGWNTPSISAMVATANGVLTGGGFGTADPSFVDIITSIMTGFSGEVAGSATTSSVGGVSHVHNFV